MKVHIYCLMESLNNYNGFKSWLERNNWIHSLQAFMEFVFRWVAYEPKVALLFLLTPGTVWKRFPRVFYILVVNLTMALHLTLVQGHLKLYRQELRFPRCDSNCGGFTWFKNHACLLACVFSRFLAVEVWMITFVKYGQFNHKAEIL